MIGSVPRTYWLARYAALVGLWLVMVILMVLDALGDSSDPSLVGTAQYGHNSEGSLRSVLPMMLAELGVALAILRPRSYHRSWSRAAVACVLFGGWGLMSLVLSMHAGGVVILHGLWVLALALACLLGLVWSLLAGRRR